MLNVDYAFNSYFTRKIKQNTQYLAKNKPNFTAVNGQPFSTWHLYVAWQKPCRKRVYRGKHRNRNPASVLFHLNIGTLDIGNFTWIAELYLKNTYLLTYTKRTIMYLEAESSEPAAALRYCEETEIPDDLCLRRRNACSTNIASDVGSMRQNDPLPDSSCDRATLMKYRFNDRLCRIEFCNTIHIIHVQFVARTTRDMWNSLVTYL